MRGMIKKTPPAVVNKATVEVKRREVRAAYSDYGFYSVEYQRSFDELHSMVMQLMTDNYRREWGLPPDAKTPYCDSRSI